jgi:hypothetical protein
MFQESRGVVDSRVGLGIRKKLMARSLETLHSPIHKVMRLRRENQEVYEMGKVQMCLFEEQVIISCECAFLPILPHVRSLGVKIQGSDAPFPRSATSKPGRRPLLFYLPFYKSTL